MSSTQLENFENVTKYKLPLIIDTIVPYLTKIIPKMNTLKQRNTLLIKANSDPDGTAWNIIRLVEVSRDYNRWLEFLNALNDVGLDKFVAETFPFVNISNSSTIKNDQEKTLSVDNFSRQLNDIRQELRESQLENEDLMQVIKLKNNEFSSLKIDMKVLQSKISELTDIVNDLGKQIINQQKIIDNLKGQGNNVSRPSMPPKRPMINRSELRKLLSVYFRYILDDMPSLYDIARDLREKSNRIPADAFDIFIDEVEDRDLYQELRAALSKRGIVNIDRFFNQ